MKRPRRVRPKDWAALEAFGHALKHFDETGDRSKLDASVVSVRSVAEGIIAIARGEDARQVFGQIGHRGRQSESVFNQTRAWVYWLARAKDPADVAGAVRAAQKHFSYLPAPSRASIERIAREYRDRILDELPTKGWCRRPDGTVETISSGIDVGPLRAYLARKDKKVERPAKRRIIWGINVAPFLKQRAQVKKKQTVTRR